MFLPKWKQYKLYRLSGKCVCVCITSRLLHPRWLLVRMMAQLIRPLPSTETEEKLDQDRGFMDVGE